MDQALGPVGAFQLGLMQKAATCRRTDRTLLFILGMSRYFAGLALVFPHSVWADGGRPWLSRSSDAVAI